MILKHSTVGMCSDSTLPARVARFHSCVGEWENAETAGSSAKNIVSSHAVATREGAQASTQSESPTQTPTTTATAFFPLPRLVLRRISP